jgi:membrane protease YdiL (CAAX protease family)
MQVIAGFVVILVLGAGLFCWTLAFFKLALGQPLVEWTPRRPVPWALLDLFAILGLYLAMSFVAAVVLRQLGWLPGRELAELELGERKLLMLANSVLSLVILAVGLPLIALRTRATLSDFGWSAREFFADVKLGAIAFFMLAPPVYAIQAVLTRFWPSKHPIIEMFRESPDPALFAVLFFAAVVVAPLAEELLFRVLLQGFLEKAFTFRGPLPELFLGSWPHQPASAAAIDAAGNWEGSVEIIRPAADATNPYLSPVIPAGPADHSAAPSAAVFQAHPPRGAAAWAPIAIASLIFALLHYGHGPDWVPLILLAAGMGYLYHRTHRLVPCLTVHALLNGLSMAGLWFTVYEQSNL